MFMSVNIVIKQLFRKQFQVLEDISIFTALRRVLHRHVKMADMICGFVRYVLQKKREMLHIKVLDTVMYQLCMLLHV